MKERIYRPKYLPMALLDGNEVEKQHRKMDRVFLKKGEKAHVILYLPNITDRNIGTTTLIKDFEGQIDGDVMTEEFHGLPRGVKRINLLPDSEERREIDKKIVNKTIFNPELDAIDKKLAQEFLRDNNVELETFSSNIDPNQITRLRLQVAIDRFIQL